MAPGRLWRSGPPYAVSERCVLATLLAPHSTLNATLFRAGSKPLDPRLLNDFAQRCFYGDINGIKRVLRLLLLPNSSAAC